MAEHYIEPARTEAPAVRAVASAHRPGQVAAVGWNDRGNAKLRRRMPHIAN